MDEPRIGVIGLDNFSKGSRENLQDVAACVGTETWSRFAFAKADFRDSEVRREGLR